MGNGKLTDHAQNLKGCEKCNLRKAVGNLDKMEKRFQQVLPVRPLMGLTTRVPIVPLLPLEKLRVRVT